MHCDPRDFLATFKDTTEELYETAKKKNNDYTGGAGAFHNFELGEKIGIGRTDQGILWRMTDKLARIISLTKVEAQVDNESVQDTLKDLANYAIILSIWYEMGGGDVRDGDAEKPVLQSLAKGYQALKGEDPRD